MASSDKSNLLTAEMNDWAVTSRWLGICSLLPALALGIVFYLEKMMDEHFFEIEFILVLFCMLLGTILGLTTLITGTVAIRQIRNSQNMEKGVPSAVLGMVLASVAIIINILLLLVPFVMFMIKD